MPTTYPEDGASFDPEAVTAMACAFSEACVTLNVLAGDARGRDVVATRIIELARRGLIDATALRDRVVAEALAAA